MRFIGNNSRRTARRALAVPAVILCLVLLFPSTPVGAHPLGNFTINQYSRLEPAGSVIRVRYIVDMAEIPAYQTIQLIDQSGDRRVDDAERAAYLDREAPALIGGLTLTLNGVVAPLRLVNRDLSFPAGQGNLPTLRLVLDLEAPLPQAPITLDYRVSNFERNLGWREILVRQSDGVQFQESNLPLQDQSDELRNYPPDMLAAPLDQRSLQLTILNVGGLQPAAEPAPASVEAPQAEDVVTRLIALPELSPPALILAIVLAAGFGAGHALTPGHGKTLVAAYMVGTRGTWKHAVVLGLATTIAHTAGVFLLGFVTLFLSAYILPEQLYPWLELVSGVMVVVIGAVLLRTRINNLLHATHRRHTHGHHHDHAHDHDHDHTHDHDHAHRHTHDHDHDHAHDHAHPHHDHSHDHAHGHTHDHGFGAHSHALPGDDGRPVTWRSLIALGVSGGLIPCPSALVILLSAIALNRVVFGLALIVAFSAGMAAVLTGIGLLLVSARRLFERLPTESRIMRVLPVFSAAIITCIGLLLSTAAILTLVS